MKIGIDNALGGLPEALSLRGQRTNLLANNIANADTPGFKARDIDFKSVLAARQSGAQGQLTNTHHKHISTNDQTPGSRDPLIKYRVPLMPSLDGNSVDAQLEQAEFSKNTMEFLSTLRILNGRFKGMLTAIKGE